MKLVFLGTGAAEGVPGLWCTCDNCRAIRKAGGRSVRRRTAMAIDDGLLIDCGPDLISAASELGLDLSRIRTMLVTHEHSDHLYLPNLEVRSGDFCVSPLPTLTVYGSESAIPLIREAATSESARHLETRVVEPFRPFDVEGYRVTPLVAQHGRPPMRPLLYAISNHEGALLYAHDTGPIPEETWAYLANPPDGQSLVFDVVTIDSTLGTRKDPGSGHLNFSQVVEHRARLAGLGLLKPNARVFANHFSHGGVSTHDAILDRFIGSGVEPAYDGLTLLV